MEKKTVYFLRAGNPYGYGYNAGEIGLINEKDFKDLQKKHVVRLASSEEVEAYESGSEPEETGKAGSETGKAGKKTGKKTGKAGSEAGKDPEE